MEAEQKLGTVQGSRAIYHINQATIDFLCGQSEPVVSKLCKVLVVDSSLLPWGGGHEV